MNPGKLDTLAKVYIANITFNDFSEAIEEYIYDNTIYVQLKVSSSKEENIASRNTLINDYTILSRNIIKLKSTDRLYIPCQDLWLNISGIIRDSRDNYMLIRAREII